MKPSQLMLRCYAEQVNHQWQAFCLDLNLAAQGDSFDEAEAKLKDMICEYVFDALAGEDQKYADQLLNRRAPWSFWIKYYYIRTFSKVMKAREVFKEPLPLTPYSDCHSH